MLALLLAAAVVNVGDTAPPLQIEQLVQAPERAQATWRALRGHAVVLEFFATWCGPCVEHIPRWNGLVEKFKGRPVQFIAISNEGLEAVRALLSKHAMAGWVGLDLSGTTFEAYGVDSVPEIFLVDPEGIVRAVTGPEHITEAAVEALLGGREVKLPQRAAPG